MKKSFTVEDREHDLDLEECPLKQAKSTCNTGKGKQRCIDPENRYETPGVEDNSDSNHGSSTKRRMKDNKGSGGEVEASEVESGEEVSDADAN